MKKGHCNFRLVMESMRPRLFFSLLGCLLFIGAFAASGRSLWLIMSGIPVLLAGIQVIKRQQQLSEVLRDLPGPDATAEEQEMAKRKFIPGHRNLELNPALLSVSALFSPPWEEIRQSIIRNQLFPPLSAKQARFRAELQPDEQRMLFHMETTLKRRFTDAEARKCLEKYRQEKENKKAKKLQREEDEAVADPVWITPAAIPVEIPSSVHFELSEMTTLPTGPEPDSVTLEPGAYEAEIQLFHTPPAEDADWPASHVHCAFNMKTHDGKRIVLFSNVGMLSLADLELEAPKGEAVFWSEVPETWRDAFKECCLASEIQVCDDGRSRFPFVLGGETHVIMTKYLHYRIDIARTADRRFLIIRVQGILSEKWTGDPFSDEWESAKFEDYIGVQPFAFRIPIERLLPVTAPDLHWDPSAENPDDGTPIKYSITA